MTEGLRSWLNWRRLGAELMAVVNYRRFQERYWNLRAPDLSCRYAYEDDFPAVERFIRSAAVARLIDIGCGYGRLFELYARAGVREVIGLEISESLMDAARKHAQNVGAQSATRFTVTGQDLRRPLPDGLSADGIISSRVLQHIHPKDIASVLERVAATGARSVYLNEQGLSGGGTSSHFFLHDYAALLRRWSFRKTDEGLIPRLNYEYAIFCR